MSKRPPNLQPLAPVVVGAQHRKEVGKLEITENMNLVLSHDGSASSEFVVTESGLKQTPALATSPPATGGAKRPAPLSTIAIPSPAALESSSSSGSNSAGGGSALLSRSGGGGADAGGSKVSADGGGTSLRIPSPNLANNAGPSPIGPGGIAGVAPACLLGRISFDELEIMEILGHGSQGTVRKVRIKSNGAVMALKSVAFSSDLEPLKKMLVQELSHTAAIKHPNVVSSYDAYFRNGKLYILMEFMDCGTCSDIIRRHRGGLTDDVVSYITRGLVTGMQHLHSENVIHRDCKPANLLVNSSGDVKISDFGVAARDAAQQLHHTNIGSTPYMSPERIKSMPYSTACDIWSIGITVAEMALGTYPFGNIKSKIFDLCEIIASGHAAPLWAELAPGRVFDPQLLDFVNQCLLPHETRPTAEKLSQHPFLDLGRNLPPAAVGTFFHSRPSAQLQSQLHQFAHHHQQHFLSVSASLSSSFNNGGFVPSPNSTSSFTSSPASTRTLPHQDSFSSPGFASALSSAASAVAAVTPDGESPRLANELRFSYRFQQFKLFHDRMLLEQQQQQLQKERQEGNGNNSGADDAAGNCKQ